MKDYSESILEVDRIRKAIHAAALSQQWWKADALTNDLLVAVSELKVDLYKRKRETDGKL
jgi:hypothetical protein